MNACLLVIVLFDQPLLMPHTVLLHVSGWCLG